MKIRSKGIFVSILVSVAAALIALALAIQQAVTHHTISKGSDLAVARQLKSDLTTHVIRVKGLETDPKNVELRSKDDIIYSSGWLGNSNDPELFNLDLQMGKAPFTLTIVQSDGHCKRSESLPIKIEEDVVEQAITVELPPMEDIPESEKVWGQILINGQPPNKLPGKKTVWLSQMIEALRLDEQGKFCIDASRWPESFKAIIDYESGSAHDCHLIQEVQKGKAINIDCRGLNYN